MTLHIGIDGSRLSQARYTGTEQYTFQLLRHMFRVAPHHRYTIYSPAPSTHQLGVGKAQVAWRILPFPRFWTLVRFSLEMAGAAPDVLFVPSHIPPLIHPKTVVTIHDLAFLAQPELYVPTERFVQQLALGHALRAAAGIVAVSKHTRDDLVKYTSLVKDRITVVYHGVDPERFHPPDIGETPPPPIAAARPYLYSVGRIELKKQTPQLIRAFRILKEKYQLPHQLVLAGAPGRHGYQEVQAVLDELPKNVRAAIQLLGYVDDETHARWIRFASCLVFPSGYEGFGMPILEAMASGVPVVASRAASLPEVVGEAGILVNQTRAEAIAEGIAAVLTDSNLRDDLIRKGKLRARQFSWERTARETVALIERVAKE